jgi:ethanolamine utilization protein EutN
MLKGRVIGNATATVRHPSMRGWKLLLVQALGPDGKSLDGDPFLAVDSLGAGIGEVVIVSSDGKGTREMLGADNSPVRWLTLGIVDG